MATAGSPGCPGSHTLAAPAAAEAVNPRVKDYLAALYSVADPRRWTLDPRPWYSPDRDIEMLCLTLPRSGLPKGFTFSGVKKDSDIPRFQYDLGIVGGKRYRPVAYRVPFLDHPEFDNPEWTVSHLCHRGDCFNPAHHTLESLAVNKSRNGCPGGPHCHHRVKCLIPGMYSCS